MGQGILLILSISLGLPLFAHERDGGFAPPDFVLEKITKLAVEYDRLTSDFTIGDVVVFDLDNTVFREAQMLGTDEWYGYQLSRFSKGRSRLEAVRQIEPINAGIKSVSQMKLMEPEIPELIRRLQDRGVLVIGLTARHPTLSESTLGQLRVFGIDFSRSAFSETPFKNFTIPNMKNALLYRGGVAFTDGATKGVVLSHMLKRTESEPKRIAAIDDRAHHMESYVEVIQEFGAEGRLIHYLKALEEAPFDPAVARVQEQVFEKLGLVLSDSEASEFVAQSEKWTAENWACSRLLVRRWPNP